MAQVARLLKGAVDVAKPNLAIFVKYAKVELVPPTPGEIPAAMRGLKNILSSAKSGKWKQITVKDAWVNTLVTAEVMCWFFVGECIGKGSLAGYKIEV